MKSEGHKLTSLLEVLNAWLAAVVPRREYHDIIRDFEPCHGEGCRLEYEEGPVGWTDERFSHVMHMRQAALQLARFAWADYFWALDADVLLSNADILQVPVLTTNS
jgi:collagen beta-1,O-galactosyltransferase